MFLHLQQLLTVRKTLTTDTVMMLVQALVTSRLDYCNSIFHLITAASPQALQSVLNAVARLVVRNRKYDHITATLHDDLHWLLIRQHVSYKQRTMDMAASVYQTEMCVPVSVSTVCQCIRLASHGGLTVPCTRTSKYGPCSFAVSCPSICNSLPQVICQLTTPTTKDVPFLLGL